MNILNMILAIFLPVGAGKQRCINVVLALCGVLPGVLHATCLLATKQKG